jgi:hypothetical protein
MIKMVYVKVEPQTVKENRKFYHDCVKHAFVKWCAYQGYFEGVFTRQEIEHAKKNGTLPQDCNIHHIMPLSGNPYSNVNDFTNLVVLHKSTHKRINKEVFQPQLQGMDKEPYGAMRVLDIPTYNYVDREGILEERKKVLDKSKKACIISSTGWQR